MFLPQNFYEVSGGIIGCMALFFCLLSLIICVRKHSVKLLAILLVASLSLYANHVATYFAAVFIIATAVTELEFLQTLAAIIRGNKEYFQYRKETLSAEAKLKRSKVELEELEPAVEVDVSAGTLTPSSQGLNGVFEVAESKGVYDISEVSPHKDFSCEDKNANDFSRKDLNIESSVHPQKAGVPVAAEYKLGLHIDRNKLRDIVKYEARALDFLELMFGTSIERDVRFRMKGRILDLDGVITTSKSPQMLDQIFEVKYLVDTKRVSNLIRVIPGLSNKLKVYSDLTGRPAVLQLVVVVEGGETLSERVTASISKAVHSSGYGGFFVFSTVELDVELS